MQSSSSSPPRLGASLAGIAVALALAGAVPALGQTPNSVLAGVYTEAQAERGAALFAMNCERCHYDDLQGAEFMAPAIGGRAFTAKWQGRTLGDTFAFISENMPYDAPKSLDAKTYTDIIAYIVKFSKYPAGKTELPADPAALKTVRVEPLP